MWYKVVLWTSFGKNVLLCKNELRELLLKSAHPHRDENELWKSSKDWKTKRSCATSRWRLWCMEKYVPAEIWYAKGELLLKWLFFVIAHLYARFLCYLKDGKPTKFESDTGQHPQCFVDEAPFSSTFLFQHCCPGEGTQETRSNRREGGRCCFGFHQRGRVAIFDEMPMCYTSAFEGWK